VPPTDPDVPGYATTLAPGTTSAAEAQKVSVGAGQTVEEINVAMVPAKLARISGSAFKGNGEPMTGGFVNASSRGADSFNGFGAPLRPDGTFLIPNVAPGDYTLTVAQSAPGPGPARPEIASATVSVAGSDVNGVQLVVVPPATASGTVILDPAAAAANKPSSIRIGIYPIEPQAIRFDSSGAIKDDYTFEMSVASGTNMVTLSGAPSLALKAVRVGGVDVTDSGFDAKAGETIRGIEIELTGQPTTVSGVVTDGRTGTPAVGSRVLIFPRDDRKWDGLSRYTRFSATDTDGKFKVTGLPPGDYYAVAGSDVQPDAGGDPDALEKLRTRAQSFSLNEGETKVLDLKM